MTVQTVETIVMRSVSWMEVKLTKGTAEGGFGEVSGKFSEYVKFQERVHLWVLER